jgi:ParB family transcriptional regulator, chromosome partitioning protein
VLASLADVGRQTPIVVAAVEGQADRYVVIDGYKRIMALGQLGQDTVDAVVWPMSEAAAVPARPLAAFIRTRNALEVGWLLAELDRRFDYGLDELARRFDRSVIWVSRLALVEVLPEAIQQQVREGKIPAQVALKFLAPAARQTLDDCQRMAANFAQRHCDRREAGQLYAAWRKGSPAIRKRILDDPELFFKTQRQTQEKAPAGAGAELLRDLEMVTQPAKWYTTSGRTLASKLRVASESRKPVRRRRISPRPSTGLRETAWISAPSLWRRWHRCVPMWPVAPVTKTLCIAPLHSNVCFFQNARC